MQLTTILILTIQAVGVLSAPHAGNEGDAPDIANSSLPPPGTAWESFSERSNPLIARNCVDSAPFGCDLKKGRCWKVCGDHGEWCWTAEGDGGGNWHTCSNWGQCNQQQACGKNCHRPSECGCTC